jgi:hypothetical protein
VRGPGEAVQAVLLEGRGELGGGDEGEVGPLHEDGVGVKL